MSARSDIINTDPESSTPEAGGVEGNGDNLQPGELASTEEFQHLERVKTWINSIESILQKAGITWDIRPDIYDVALEALYIADIVDMNKLMRKMLNYWRIQLSQNGPESYAITIEPIKPLFRGLMSGGASPEEAIVNVIFRYLNEVGTERLKE